MLSAVAYVLYKLHYLREPLRLLFRGGGGGGEGAHLCPVRGKWRSCTWKTKKTKTKQEHHKKNDIREENR